MSEAPRKRKGTRKKSSQVEDAGKFGVHKVPEDVVEIERNILENWLIALKHWFKINIKTTRYIIFSTLFIVVMGFTLIFVHSAVSEKHNETFYSLMDKFDEITDNSTVKLNALAKDTDKLCNTVWQTKHSPNGCLLSALTYKKLAQHDKVSKSLQLYSENVDNSGISAFSLFYAAYHSEVAKDFDNSEVLYKELQNKLKIVEKEDIAIYQLAKIKYYKKDYNGARNLMNELLEKHSKSAYIEKAKKYLLLISIKENAVVENGN